MPVSKKRKDIKHISGTGICKTLKGKQMQNGNFHVRELTNPFDIRGLMSKFPNMRNHIADVITNAAKKREAIRLKHLADNLNAK